MLASLALAGAASAQSNHYRWTDADGETVLSDRPPPAGVDYEIVSSTSNFTRKVSAGEGALKPGDDSNAADAAVAEANAERARQAAAACKAAQANLKALKGEAKIVVRTPDGGQRALSADEIEMQRQTAQSQVEAYCP